jgi:UDP-3-O-[3-hydroxymyristoyl] glucosamine N-acyltransferase
MFDAGVHVAPGVILGTGATIEPPALVGKAPRGREEGELPLVIGAAPTIRAFTTIYAGSTFGDRLQTGHGASIREDNVVGDDVRSARRGAGVGNRMGYRVRSIRRASWSGHHRGRRVRGPQSSSRTTRIP